MKTSFVIPALIMAVAAPSMLAAQSGVGTAGAQVLQLPAGSRAPALAGAYTATAADADVLFYDPAGLAGLGRSVSVAYQSYFEDIRAGSAAAAFKVGRMVLGGGILYLDAGSIDEIVPDPNFGNQRGKATGATARATETAARLSAATSLLDGRLRLGANIGAVSTDLAGVGRSAPFVDLGAQYAMRMVSVGASLRHLGGSMTNADNGDAPLPGEARLGIAVHGLNVAGFGVALTADGLYRLQEGTVGMAGGVEAGILPGSYGPFSAVLRAGLSLESGDALAPYRFGAGISFGAVGVDYTYQDYDLLGAVHRIGLRWTMP
ncbi:MAG TPA: hypothetical protein VJ957_08810 [Longimicrobiales bacterium]|nr:hypothetical protein [Longimicrobiales bacterium]